MLFNEWQDFITHPLDSSRVKSRKDRLDTTQGTIIPISMLLRGSDEFECMEITDLGDVTVWTRDKVWFLVREGTGQQIEKLRYIPRHPTAPSGFGSS